MATSRGTVGTGVAVLDPAAVQAAALDALDAELIGNYVTALGAANKSAGLFLASMGAVAGAILDLHQAETWRRTIDGETGKPYSSAKAFYAALNRDDRFPHLHRVLRSELIGTLMDGDTLAGIGTNELAALIGCDPAQITRTVKAINAQNAADAVAAAEAAEAERLDTVAAEAAAAALAEGKSEAEAAHAGEAARAAAKAEAAEANADADADAKLAEAKSEAKATAKAAAKAVKVFASAVAGVRQYFPVMTPEDGAATVKLVAELAGELENTLQLMNQALAEHKAEQARAQRAAEQQRNPKPGTRRNAG